MNRLFFETPGEFRLFIFVVTTGGFESSGKPLKMADADASLRAGQLILPDGIAMGDSTKARCTALIYHFRKSPGDPAKVLDSSPVLAAEHLIRAGVVPP